MAHGLIESYEAMVIECVCGKTLIAKGSQEAAEIMAAHALPIPDEAKMQRVQVRTR